jgi:two-component system cell cycle response regulator
MPRRTKVLLAVGLAGVATQLLHALAGVGPAWLYEDVFYNATELVAAVLILDRARTRSEDRAAWLLLGLGVLGWTLGDICWSFVLSDSTGTPSIADAFYLAFYPCALSAVILLARRHVRVRGWSMRLDGVVAALGLSAIATSLMLGPALVVDGSFAEKATLLAYPVGDLLLFGLVGGMSITGGRRTGAPWMLLGAALGAVAVADGIYLAQATAGTYVEGGLLDVCWISATLAMAFAAWRPAPEAGAETVEDWRSRLVPSICGLAAVILLVVDHFAGAAAVGVLLAAATLFAVLGRLILTARESDALLELTHQDAITDALTGLGNRRALLAHLDRACASGRPGVLVVFDLNGFKRYNDTFGHPAGDALLQRLGERLGEAGHGGAAYRLGGDEFCLVAEAGPDRAPAIAARAVAALAEHGEGFTIDSSHGFVLLGSEATHPSEAMRIADRRMYAQKHSLQRDDGYIREALLRTVQEGHPELGLHQDKVAGLARTTAMVLGLDAEEIDVTIRAAELHDIGKVAIPDEILNKAEPLTEHEWTFIRRHTIVGERILAASPALAPVAAIVRASHEAWDGTGYPDGLSGETIPLAARIVAVCDAFDVMTSPRAYQPALPASDAVAELVSCAGHQFDPRVVAAFCRAIDQSPREAGLEAPEGCGLGS